MLFRNIPVAISSVNPIIVRPILCEQIATKVEMKKIKPKTENAEIIMISLVLNFASVAGLVVVQSVVKSVVVGLVGVVSLFSPPVSFPLPKEFDSSVKELATKTNVIYYRT